MPFCCSSFTATHRSLCLVQRSGKRITGGGAEAFLDNGESAWIGGRKDTCSNHLLLLGDPRTSYSGILALPSISSATPQQRAIMGLTYRPLIHAFPDEEQRDELLDKCELYFSFGHHPNKQGVIPG